MDKVRVFLAKSLVEAGYKFSEIGIKLNISTNALMRKLENLAALEVVANIRNVLSSNLSRGTKHFLTLN